MYKIKRLEFETTSDQKMRKKCPDQVNFLLMNYFCIFSLDLCINSYSKKTFTLTKLQDTAEDTFAETLAEIFEAIEEAAPAVAAAGGSVAAAAMFAMPSLPMTLASGVPPGTKLFFSKLLKQFFVLPYFP